MKRVLLGFVLVFTSVRGVVAQTVLPAPSLMNFQGRLAKPDGTAIANGAYAIVFSIYDAPTGGISSGIKRLPALPFVTVSLLFRSALPFLWDRLLAHREP